MVSEKRPADWYVFRGRANSSIAFHPKSMNVILNNTVVVFRGAFTVIGLWAGNRKNFQFRPVYAQGYRVPIIMPKHVSVIV